MLLCSLWWKRVFYIYGRLIATFISRWSSRRRDQGIHRLNKVSGNESSCLCIQQRDLKKLRDGTTEMLLPCLRWSLSPRVVLVVQGKREASVIPIFAELQGRPEDYWLTKPVSVCSGILVEVKYKIWVRVIDERKVKTAFVEEKKKNSLKVSNLVGENNPFDTGCLDFWKTRSLTKRSWRN